MPAPSEKSRDGTSGRRRGLLYGRRKGPKLSAHQASLVRVMLPGLKLDLRKNADPVEYFDTDVEGVWLEIGFGAGEHLIWQAEHHPEIGIIGAEPYESGVAKLLSKLNAHEAAKGLSARIRGYIGDARDVIDGLPASSLGRVFLLFPDPWPKKRHHKRRFIQMETLDALARVMKVGAELRFASDDADYVSWTLERLLAHGAFVWTAACVADWLSRPQDWPPTRYEQKALHGGPVFLRFERVEQRAGSALANCLPGA